MAPIRTNRDLLYQAYTQEQQRNKNRGEVFSLSSEELIASYRAKQQNSDIDVESIIKAFDWSGDGSLNQYEVKAALNLPDWDFNRKLLPSLDNVKSDNCYRFGSSRPFRFY